MRDPIKTPRDYFENIVKPACAEFIANPSDKNKAIVACEAVWNLSERVVNSYDPLKDGNIQNYRSHLAASCPDLLIAGHITNSVKHYPPQHKNTVHYDVGVSSGCDAVPKSLSGEYVVAAPLSGPTAYPILITQNCLNLWQSEFSSRGW